MIKKVKDFLSFSNVNRQYKSVEDFCNKYLDLDVDYSINKDYSIDVHGSVDIGNNGFKKIPVKFNIVEGSFDCSDNDLTSLENCPNIVGGNFKFDDNQISSLEYFPKSIGGTINAFFNKITDISILKDRTIKLLYMERNYLTNISPDQYKYTRTNRCPIDYFIGILCSEHALNIKYSDVKKRIELVEKLEEFEVIKHDNEIDIISLNSLFDYYEKKFLKDYLIERISLIKYSDTPDYRKDIVSIANEKAYKIINQ